MIFTLKKEFRPNQNLLLKHECKIENYIILDDEDTDLQSFVGSHLVKTSHNDYKGYIACSERKWSGLANEHVKQAIKILNEQQ